ncbi:outer membrane protein assembly factor BamE [Candidatus Vallotia tarda]|uniref:outer membrane protein assembly factor BamE n=1 Tax=Candidatus Vallotiella hemipterorum TaxID=1177213 RepID=UPI003B968515
MDKKSSTFSYVLRMRTIALSVMVRILIFMGITSLGACKTCDGFTQSVVCSIAPYRTTIVQGNFVSAESASRLHVGMSGDEVRSLVGTPLLTDMFHVNRWDYLFYFKRGWTSVVQQRDLVINFISNRVVSWTGAKDLLSERELIAEIDDSGRKSKKSRG